MDVSCSIKEDECWRIDAFELWCWRRLLRVPRTARISNQSILKEISPEYSLEGLMLKLKLQYFGHLLQRADSFKKTFVPWKKSYDKPRMCIKKQRHYFANKDLYGQSYGFSSSHVWMWELDCKESWAPKNWYFWTVVLEKTLESLDCKVIKSVNSKEISPE